MLGPELAAIVEAVAIVGKDCRTGREEQPEQRLELSTAAVQETYSPAVEGGICPCRHSTQDHESSQSRCRSVHYVELA